MASKKVSECRHCGGPFMLADNDVVTQSHAPSCIVGPNGPQQEVLRQNRNALLGVHTLWSLLQMADAARTAGDEEAAVAYEAEALQLARAISTKWLSDNGLVASE